MSEKVPVPVAVAQPFTPPAVTKTSPEMKAIKRRSNLKALGAMVAALLGSGGTGYFTHKGADKETHDDVSVVKQQLEDHIQVSNERNKELKDEQHKLHKRAKRLETIQLINKAQNDLVLDKLGVPKSKRPTEATITPAEDE